MSSTWLGARGQGVEFINPVLRLLGFYRAFGRRLQHVLRACVNVSVCLPTPTQLIWLDTAKVAHIIIMGVCF